MRRAGRVTLATDRAQCGGSCLRTPLLHGPDVRMTLPVISALRIKHRQHYHDVLQSYFSFWKCEQARVEDAKSQTTFDGVQVHSTLRIHVLTSGEQVHTP